MFLDVFANFGTLFLYTYPIPPPKGGGDGGWGGRR